MCVYACIYLCSLVFIFFKSSIFKSKVKYICIYIFIVYKIYISTRLSYLKIYIFLNSTYIIYTNFLICYRHVLQIFKIGFSKCQIQRQFE